MRGFEESLEKIAVKVVCNEESGSGFLYQPNSSDFSYVVTAKHCLDSAYLAHKNIYEKQQIHISRYSNNTFEPMFSVLNVTCHRELDVAVIKVGYIEDLPSITITKPRNDLHASFYGFPYALTDDESDPRHAVDCTVGFCREREIDLLSRVSTFTYTKSAEHNFKAFSGSGVFVRANESVCVIGVFTGFKTSDAAWETFNAIDINELNHHLQNVGWPLLLTNTLVSFKGFIDTAFKHFNNNIQAILMTKAEEILHITPYHILDKFKSNLYLPYEDRDIHSEEVWKGWLSLLTYLSIEKDLRDFDCLTRTSGESTSIIRFYYSQDRLEEVVNYVFTQGFISELKQNDKILINSEGPVGTASISVDRVKKIAARIDQAILYKNKIKIDDPYFTKDISCLHLEQFSRSFSAYSDIDDINELENELKKAITEVLENVV